MRFVGERLYQLGSISQARFFKQTWLVDKEV